MLNYTVELKSEEAIKELCYETESGGLGQDYIAFDYNVLQSNGFCTEGVTLVGVKELEEGMYAYLIQADNGRKIYVHLDWLYKVNNHVVLSNLDHSKEMIKITRKEVFYPATGEIKDIGDIPMCDCGAMGTTQMSDGNWICNTCMDKLTEINSYSFKPTPNFIGKQLKADTDTPVWYGLEIEVSTKKDKLSKVMYNHKDAMYLKSDSSIRGQGYNVEMVTHPHSFSELMNGQLLKDIGTLPTNDEVGNGLHIHVSRTAFKDDRHYALFYFLIHKMEKLCTKVGGRDLTDFCKLKPSGKIHQKENSSYDVGDRSLFLNERNDATIEARFFKGTTDTNRIKADIQLLESLIKYTRYHTKTVTTKGWYRYVKGKATKYAELLDVLGEIDVNSLTDKVVYKEPTYITKKYNDCTIDELKHMVKIEMTDGSVWRNFDLRYIIVDESSFEIRRHNGGSRSVYFRDIKHVVLEKE